MSQRRRTLVALAATLTLVSAADAGADATFTAPTGDRDLTIDTRVGAPNQGTLPANGTSTETSGNLELFCHSQRTGGNPIGVPFATNGTWTTTASLSSFTLGCKLFAQPEGSPSPSVLGAPYAAPVLAYSGPSLYGANLDDDAAAGASAGALESFSDSLAAPTARATSTPAGNDGGPSLQTLSTAIPRSDGVLDGLYYFAANGLAGARRRSELMADGRTIMLPGQQPFTPTTQAGAPVVTTHAASRAADGTLTTTTIETTARCALGEGVGAEPSSVDCGAPGPTGLRLVRRTTIAPDARRVRVLDRWESTDGAAHALDLRPDFDFVSKFVRFPWVDGTDYVDHTGIPELPAPPAAPFTVFGRTADDATTATPARPLGAVTIGDKPIAIPFYGDNPKYPELQVTPAVPAGGAYELGWSFTTADDEQAIRAAGAADAAAFAEAPALTAALAGATVSGTVAAPGGLADLTVAGAHVNWAADGTWSAPAAARPFAVVATTHGGTARTVTFAANPVTPPVTTATAPPAVTPPVVPPKAKRCKVPKLAGKTPTAAKAALKKAGCRVGTTLRRYVKPAVERVNGKTRTIPYRTGRVVRSSPAAGRTIAATTKVTLTVQKPKPRRRR